MIPLSRPPTAFISYSWDSDDHREWVKHIATRLFQDGVDVKLDAWDVRPGDQLPAYMETAVRENDVVLCICTPRYAQKFNARSGGVGYEGDIMTAEALIRGNHRKFIPVLRSGAHATSMPSWLLGKAFVNLSDNPVSEREYKSLLNAVYGRRPDRPERDPNRPPGSRGAPGDGDGEDRQRSRASYPPLVFRTDDNSEVLVGGPVELAGLLEQNPEHGSAVLYGKYVEAAGWHHVNPGLCAALSAVVEQKYPHDRDAGLAAAIYLLDPARPYRAGATNLEGYVKLAEHLAANPHTYRTALQGPNHSLWIYLASRTDARVRDGRRPFAAAFAAASGPADGFLALNRLILWLRGLEGEKRLPFAGTLLSEPCDLLARPLADRQRAANDLADPASLLSVWVSETSPGVRPTLERWRRHRSRHVETLPYALGRGVRAGRLEIRSSRDALAGDPATMAALWEGSPALLADVEEYLSLFRDTSLVLAAHEWLRIAPVVDHLSAVVAFVVARVPDLLLRLAGQADSVAAAAEPWSVLLQSVAPVVFRALARLDAEAARAGARRENVLAAMVRHATATLEAPSDRISSQLRRLALWMAEAAAALVRAGPVPAEARLWRAFIGQMDGAITRLHRQGYADDQDLAASVEARPALRRALETLQAGGARLTFDDRLKREEAAHARQAEAIRSTVATERAVAARAAVAEEAGAVAAAREAAAKASPTAELASAERRARLALFVLAAGAASFAYLTASLLREAAGRVADYRALFPDIPRGAFEVYASTYFIPDTRFPVRLAFAYALLVASAAVLALLVAKWRLHPIARIILCGLLGTLAFVGAFVGVALAPVPASYAIPIVGVATLGGLGWTWRAIRTRRRTLSSMLARVVPGPAQMRQLEANRREAEQALAGRERTWLLAARRALALADDPDVIPLPAATAGVATAGTTPTSSMRPVWARRVTVGAVASIPLWAPPAALHALVTEADPYLVIVTLPDALDGPRPQPAAQRLQALRAEFTNLPASENDGRRILFGPFAERRARRVRDRLHHFAPGQSPDDASVIATPSQQRYAMERGYFKRRYCGCRR